MRSAVAFFLFLITSSCYADVFKCTEDNKTIYSDVPCSTAGRKLRFMAGNSGFETSDSVRDAIKENSLGIDPDASTPPECKFKYFVYGDEKGKTLAKAAKAECVRNLALKAKKRADEMTTEAYKMWNDHWSTTAAMRQSAVNASVQANSRR